MRNKSKILILFVIVSLLFCSCSAAGGGLFSKSEDKNLFANRSFGNAKAGNDLIMMVFTDTTVKHTFNSATHDGTYTADKGKSGKLNITYSDGIPAASYTFQFNSDNSSFTIDGAEPPLVSF